MNEYDLDKIGKFIATRRKKLNIKQNELAEMIGTTFKTVSKWENGRGFPDLVLQKPLCNSLKITLDELHNGQIDNFKRVKNIITYVLSILFIFILPLCIFFANFYKNNHNSQVYQLEGVNIKNEYNLKGLLIKKDDNYIFSFGNIQVNNLLLTTADIVSINIYHNDELVFHTNQYDYFYFSLNKKDVNNFSNWSYKIVVNNKMSSEGIINIIRKNITKTEINKEIKDNNNKSIKDKLIKSGFKEKNPNEYEKVIKGDEGKINVLYNVSEKTFEYNEENSLITKYFHYVNFINSLEVMIFESKSNIRTLIERYEYNYNDNKLSCEIGSCSTLDDVKNIMKEYINLLTVE